MAYKSRYSNTAFGEGEETAISDQMLNEFSMKKIQDLLNVPPDLKLEEVRDERAFAQKIFKVVKKENAPV